MSLLFVALPATAFAAVRISAVMYDPEGADTGHEWIELTNTGSDSVNLAGYKLFENGTNHKLVAVVGTSTIKAGAKAVIATDVAQYSADHPAFTGTIFKSSFSLSNTGETIELRDSKLQTVDSYTYTAPPVVKKAPAAKKTSKKSSVSGGESSYTYIDHMVSGAELAASPVLSLPSFEVPTVWLYGLALALVALFGIAGVFYIQLFGPRPPETNSGADEFELEN